MTETEPREPQPSGPDSFGSGDGPDRKTPSNSKPRRRWRRRLLWTLGVLLLLVGIGPLLATRGPGRAWIQRRLSRETHLQVELGSISTWWWSPITVRDITVTTDSGRPVAKLEQLRTGRTLLGLIFGGVEKGEIQLLHPDVELQIDPESRQELGEAVRQIDPMQGLLYRLLRPDEDTRLTFSVVDASVSVQPRDLAWQRIVHTANPRVRLERISDELTLTVAPGEICQLEVSPAFCDLGLEFLLPVLAGALAAEGRCALHLSHCQVDPRRLAACEVEGQLVVQSIRAEVDGPLLSEIAALVADIVRQGDLPMSIQLADNCAVDFAVAGGVVRHEGLEFGLPKVLPELVLQTRGDIAFDKSLALEVAAEIPFNKFGEAEVLQRLGAPKLAVPIAGTLDAPKLEIGEGQVTKGLVTDLVKSLTDERIDPGPLLDQIGQLGLLERRRERRAQREAEASAAGDPAAASDPAAGSDPAADSLEDPEPRDGLLKRLRKRGGLLKRRDR